MEQKTKVKAKMVDPDLPHGAQPSAPPKIYPEIQEPPEWPGTPLPYPLLIPPQNPPHGAAGEGPAAGTRSRHAASPEGPD